MKLAYVILCHRNASQVKRLIDKLRNQDTTFVLHVSRNCDTGFYEEISSQLVGYANLCFCKREDGTHNGFGIVNGIINALQLLLDKQVDFDYVNLLSGQDYPIKSNQYISHFFEQNNGKEFLEFFPIFPIDDLDLVKSHPWGNDRQLYRIDRFHFKIDGAIRSIPELLTGRLIDKSLFKTLKIFLFESSMYFKQKRWLRELQLLFWSRVLPNKRKLLSDVTYYGGKTWWSVTKACAQFIVKEHRANKALRNFFQYTLIPDEMYFQTMLLNSPFSSNCVNSSLRLIKWEAEDGTHPIFLKMNHLPMISQSEALFARKFDMNQNPDVLDAIDRKMLD